MIVVLGNFAGVFSNICKLLQWSIAVEDSDILLFYYANKFKENQNPEALPYEDYEKDLERVFFYKYFEYPKGCDRSTFLQDHTFHMAYPTIPTERLPACLQKYPNGYIYTIPDVYLDPNFPEIRSFYHTHFQKRLSFTKKMEDLVEDELTMLRMVQSEGKRILAVFLRTTIHYNGYNVQNVFNEIDDLQKDFDYILPITQVMPFYNQMIETYGRKCIPLSRNRMDFDQDWWYNTTDEPFEEEFRMAIADVYLASQCDFIISGASNMFLGALFMNPTVPFKLYKELETKTTG